MPNKQAVKKLNGIALSDSRNKSVKVRANFIKAHPIYQKRVVRRRTFLVHTDQEIKKGQKVIIFPTRPISKRKSWKVIK